MPRSSQHADGFWDVSDGLAVAVLSPPQPPAIDRTGRDGRFAEEMKGVAQQTKEAKASLRRRAARAVTRAAWLVEKLLRRTVVLAVISLSRFAGLGGDANQAGAGGGLDMDAKAGSAKGDALGCPFSGFDPDQIEMSIPAQLRALGLEQSSERKREGGHDGLGASSEENGAEAEGNSGTSLDAGRVWATCISLATLSTFDESWLTSAGCDCIPSVLRCHMHEMQASNMRPFTDRSCCLYRPLAAADPVEGSLATCSDAATAWLASEAVKFPALDGMMDSLLDSADALVASWQLRQRAAIRGAWTAHNRHNPSRTGYEAQRAAGWMVFALLRKHEQAAVVFSPSTDGLLRWQRVLVLFTAVLSLFTTTIWLYYSRSLTCCIEIRELLGCDTTDLAGPCRGSELDCGMLLDQFAEVFPAELEEYVCQAFPFDDNPRDRWLCGFIQVAVAFPVFVVIQCAGPKPPRPSHRRRLSPGGLLRDSLRQWESVILYDRLWLSSAASLCKFIVCNCVVQARV